MKTLRKIGMAFLAVVLCASFVACSDDDENVYSQLIVGNWVSDNYSSEIWTINSNGTGVAQIESSRETFKWKMKADSIYFSMDTFNQSWAEKIETLTQNHLVLVDEDGDKREFTRESNLGKEDLMRLLGTWNYVSDDFDDGKITFKDNGELEWFIPSYSSDDLQDLNEATYELNGDGLVIYYVDCLTKGTISFSKNKAIYKYHYEDPQEGLYEDDIYTMTLTR